MTRQYKTSPQLKNAAKDSLTGKYGNAILILFLNNILSSVASLFILQFFMMATLSIEGLSQQANTIILSVLFQLILLGVNIVMGVLTLGVNLFFLNAACGQPASVNDLFYGIRNQFRRALTISAVLVLANTICLLPYQIFAELYLNTQDSKWLILLLAAGVSGLVIYVPLSLSLSQSFYLLLDFPEKKPGELLKLSMHLMKGHKRRLFYIQASFIPLILLCLLSFGIGLLWLAPYMEMTYAHFFLDLMKPAEKMD